jgi:hypothetical protein
MGPSVGEVRWIEPQHCRKLMHPAPLLSGSPPEQIQGGHGVLGSSHVGKETHTLKAISDRPPEVVRGELSDIDPIDPYGPGGWLDQPLDELESGGFPASRHTEQDQKLAGVNIKGEMVHCNNLTVSFHNIFELNHVWILKDPIFFIRTCKCAESNKTF